MSSYFITPKDIFCQASDEPIITSLLDLDIYKYPMGQLIWSIKQWAEAKVKFSLIVRTEDIKLAEIIKIDELREQLNHIRTLRLSEAEIAFLRGMPMPGDRRMFEEDFLQFLKKLQLPDFHLEEQNGHFNLNFEGNWSEITYWETIAMSLISEMYYFGIHRKHKVNRFEFMSIYAAMLQRLNKTIDKLKEEPQLTFSEFGTRRRHSKKWQQVVMQAFKDMLPKQCVGSSNVMLSMQLGSSNPKGTNAHELPMVAANLTDESDDAIRNSQYDIVEQWYAMYPELSVILPDTFGTTQFLENAPEWMAQKCVGARIDSKDPDIATEEYIAWWKKNGVDPMTKILIPSDGLDADKMVALYKKHGHRVGTYTFGLGTMATNDCKGCWTSQAWSNLPQFKPFSMVIKVVEANGKSAVKLSDNPGKAMGSAERVERFKRIFGVTGMDKQEIYV
jgi:nicotinate phosphoribosyltransferase